VCVVELKGFRGIGAISRLLESCCNAMKLWPEIYRSIECRHHCLQNTNSVIKMSKKILQIVLAVLGLIPILTGVLDLVLGASSLNLDGALLSPEVVNNIVLDSQIRFLGSIWLGFGIILYWMLFSIEKQTILFRLVAGSIFLGGIGRLTSAFLVGLPPILLIAATVLELVGMPLLVLWQSLISMPSHSASNSVAHKTSI
jgi:Domain of unknown function (DUF4345)